MLLRLSILTVNKVKMWGGGDFDGNITKFTGIISVWTKSFWATFFRILRNQLLSQTVMDFSNRIHKHVELSY